MNATTRAVCVKHSIHLAVDEAWRNGIDHRDGEA